MTGNKGLLSAAALACLGGALLGAAFNCAGPETTTVSRCTGVADCPGLDSECQTRTCLANLCGVVNAPSGTALSQQHAGDCKGVQCDGAGQTAELNDDADLPIDNNPCTADVCTAGVASNPPEAKGVSCGGSQSCDGTGVCVGCLDASTCPGQDSACQSRTCVAGSCGLSFVAAGTPIAAQTAGDCHQLRCDGAGGTVAASDDADLPDDSNACTRDACSGGTPFHAPLSEGNPCSQNGGNTCNGQGACVQCLVATSCPGQDSDCQTRTCTAGVCGLQFAAAGTATSAQTTGDCKVQRCDGAGASVLLIDDADLPEDNNPCTQNVCSAGVPSHPPVGSGASCGGTQVCNGSGACVGCVTAATCPGQNTECQTRTCNTGTCGFTYTAAGMPVSGQTQGDCKVLTCNGSGGTATAVDNTDLPIDNNACTADVCTAGTPSHPPTAAGTACNQGGGTVCNGAGACKQCIFAPSCPGTDTECQTRTCVSGSCGFSYAPVGTPVTSQTTGDCKKNICNGSGTPVTIVDNTDLPVDNLQCTNDFCSNGTPSNPPKPAGTACTQNGGTFCSSGGSCVQCAHPSDCPGQDTECQTRTCNQGACGFVFSPAGSAVSAQTAGDCKKNSCNGSGGITTVTDNTDLPTDSNACTSDLCNNGVPSHSPVAAGTACNQNGGSICDSSASCVQCLSPTTCPGQDTECQTRTCLSGACGLSYTAAGTATTAQTAGDCKKNTCNGAGSVGAVNDDSDLPADNNPCTVDMCTTGIPSHSPEPLGTPCNQLGGTACDGYGTCVP